MFLEYWMIGVLGALFVVALIHTDRSASERSFSRGAVHGADLALKLLEIRGVIKIVDDKIIPQEYKENEEKL
jgi:hypothetical protein